MDQVEYQKIKSYAEKNNLTLSKACKVFDVAPKHFYAFTERAKRLGTQSLERKKPGPKSGYKRGPRMQTVVVEAPAASQKIIALVGQRADVVEALRALL